MNLWLCLGSLLPGLCMAFLVGSRLSRRAPGWLTRAAFGVTAGLTAATLYWTYHRVDQVTTTVVISASLLVIGALTASAYDLGRVS